MINIQLGLLLTKLIHASINRASKLIDHLGLCLVHFASVLGFIDIWTNECISTAFMSVTLITKREGNYRNSPCEVRPEWMIPSRRPRQGE
jgi:hypothetical protein